MAKLPLHTVDDETVVSPGDHDSAIRTKSSLLTAGRSFAPTEVAAQVDAVTAITVSQRDVTALVQGELSLEERYVAGELLGEGGMGEVRLCRDRCLGRDVAVKTVRSEYARSTEIKARFAREARVQGQLEHPSIVPVYDLHADAQGALYFTMKRVHGITLESILVELRGGDVAARTKYSRDKLLRAFVTVCQAVDFAHARGVLHRDLKPANVMLGSYGEVYVLDWGIAKIGVAPESTPEAVFDGGALPSSKTAYGAVMGTPGYMAPEQLRGEVATLDARTDVYALGAILFEIVTMRSLHQGNSAAEMHASTVGGVDIAAAVRASARDIPPELEDICVHATAQDPKDRFASAGEMCEALDRFLEGDRDVERRKALAKGHASAAADRAARALSGSEADAETQRRLALREVGSALALDATNAEAMRTLVGLLTAPPAEMPDELCAEMLEDIRAAQSAKTRMAVVPSAIWVVFALVGFWSGACTLPVAAFFVAVWSGAAAMCLWVSRRPHPEGKVSLPLLATLNAALVCTTAAFGPLLLVPALCTFNAMMFMSNPDRSRRWVVMAMGCVVLAGPLALEWMGVVPRSYAFMNGTLTIIPRVVALSSRTTIPALVVANVLIVLLACVNMAQLRDRLSAAERRLYLQAWQLRQIVPDSATPKT